MAAVTERYVDARTDAVRAEHDAAIARPSLTLQASSHRRMLWIIGWMSGLVATTSAIIIGEPPITAAIPKPVEG